MRQSSVLSYSLSMIFFVWARSMLLLFRASLKTDGAIAIDRLQIAWLKTSIENQKIIEIYTFSKGLFVIPIAIPNIEFSRASQWAYLTLPTNRTDCELFTISSLDKWDSDKFFDPFKVLRCVMETPFAEILKRFKHRCSIIN